MSLCKLHDWSNTWLLSLNVQKWKVVSYGRHADKNYKYKMIRQDRIIELDCEDHIKDLGVIFDENLDFGVQELISVINNAPCKPKIIALTEIKHKSKWETNLFCLK